MDEKHVCGTLGEKRLTDSSGTLLIASSPKMHYGTPVGRTYVLHKFRACGLVFMRPGREELQQQLQFFGTRVHFCLQHTRSCVLRVA